MHKNNYKLSWISWSILVAVGVVNGADEVNKEGAKCNHPPVPAAATYVNVTGGLGEQEWVVRYICDNGKHANFSQQNGKIKIQAKCAMHFLSNLLVLQCKIVTQLLIFECHDLPICT